MADKTLEQLKAEADAAATACADLLAACDVCNTAYTAACTDAELAYAELFNDAGDEEDACDEAYDAVVAAQAAYDAACDASNAAQLAYHKALKAQEKAND